MLTATPRVRNFEGATIRHTTCASLDCDWTTDAPGKTPAAAKTAAQKALLAHLETCPHYAADRAKQEAIASKWRAGRDA